MQYEDTQPFTYYKKTRLQKKYYKTRCAQRKTRSRQKISVTLFFHFESRTIKIMSFVIYIFSKHALFEACFLDPQNTPFCRRLLCLVVAAHAFYEFGFVLFFFLCAAKID
eukprot:GEMP01087656.1.p1 GENE.GEMP01087656.1~~GEMP01087656.1.p1  ORF type:complete len:110 (-),score=1.33 GEMP01087656.1:352-681(-)